MKKTTTRLVTVAAVILLGAFAIALAQHDSRNREQEPIVANEFASKPAIPIAVDGEWELDRSIVRGNNQMPQTLTATDMPTSDAWVEDANPLRDPPNQSADNEAFPEDFSSQIPDEMPDESSDVVMAAGEEPLQAPSDQVPSWLADAADALPSLPEALPAAMTAVPRAEGAAGATPLPRLPDSPAESTPASGFQLPSTPEDNASSDSQFVPAAISQPSAGTPAGSASSPRLPQQPRPNAELVPNLNELPGRPGTSNGMSDTQRGAMVPTTLSSPAPAALPAAPPNQSAGGAAYYGRGLPPENTPPSASSTSAGGVGTGEPAALTGGPQSPQRIPAAQPTLGSGSLPATLAALSSNQPGDRYLDGSQNPIMLIHKRAPEEVQVGKQATFVITVRNSGNATAHDVTVVDSVPQGARFAESNPAISPTANGLLTWKLGAMAAGDEKTISLQIVPEAQGEVGSVASVHFVAQASVRTVATLPKIEIELEAQPDVLIGDSQVVHVTIRNSGTGVARNVRLEADIPPQLRHESGDAFLDAGIGDLRPHEARRMELVAAAVQPGRAACVVRAVSDDGVQAEQTVPIDVRSPQLVASIEGPSLRYLERQATYQIKVQNSGTAAASNLDFVAHLPAGLKFVSTDVPQSSYDPKSHTVSLGLFELAAGQVAPIALTVLPVELGPQVIKFNATADLGMTAEAKGQVMVDGLAELAFTIGQDNGTVEVGASSTYSVQITNVGNKPDKEVQLLVQLPNGAELLAVDAPVDYRTDGNKLVFAPISEMRNKDQHTIRFQVRHTQAGNQVVRSQLTSANWPVAVVKEEGTLVYNDQK